VFVWTFYPHTSLIKAYQQECKLNIAAGFVCFEKSRLACSLFIIAENMLHRFWSITWILTELKQDTYIHLRRKRNAYNWQSVDNCVDRRPVKSVHSFIFQICLRVVSTASCQVFLLATNVLPHNWQSTQHLIFFFMLMTPNIF